jgi:hypothetical protein
MARSLNGAVLNNESFHDLVLLKNGCLNAALPKAI